MIEDRMQEAADELQQVSDLLTEEVSERARLEKKLVLAGHSPN